jgi:Bifunctional DNA primase/polymerase, N-terminal
MLDGAYSLAAVGWEVFPCLWCGKNAKAPLVPSPGFHLATSDPEQIELWWTKWPKAMIGARIPASTLVIDVDPRKGGDLAKLVDSVGALPLTLTVWSGRNDGGCHLYFRRSGGLATTSTRLPEGIDLKDAGKGYCIMPPSIHPATGQPYRWEMREPAILPQRLRELLRYTPPPVRPFSSNGDGSGLVRKVAETGEGNRDRVLYWAARCAVDEGLIDDIERDLVAASISTGFPEKQAWNKIKSARKAAGR